MSNSNDDDRTTVPAAEEVKEPAAAAAVEEINQENPTSPEHATAQANNEESLPNEIEKEEDIQKEVVESAAARDPEEENEEKDSPPTAPLSTPPPAAPQEKEEAEKKAGPEQRHNSLTMMDIDSSPKAANAVVEPAIQTQQTVVPVGPNHEKEEEDATRVLSSALSNASNDESKEPKIPNDALKMAIGSPPKQAKNTGSGEEMQLRDTAAAAVAAPKQVEKEEESTEERNDTISTSKFIPATISSPGWKSISTAVAMLDKDTCELIQVFHSMRQAERELRAEVRIDRKQLKQALEKQADGKPGIAHGYRWRLPRPEDYEVTATITEQASPAKQMTQETPPPKASVLDEDEDDDSLVSTETPTTRPAFTAIASAVAMLDLDTCEVVRIFPSVRRAALEAGIDRFHLRKALDKLQDDGLPPIMGNNRWRWPRPEDEETLSRRQQHAKSNTSPMSVAMLDIETCEVIKIFYSMRQVTRETGISREALKEALAKQADGKPGIANGYRWRYPRPGDEEAIAKRKKEETAARRKAKEEARQKRKAKTLTALAAGSFSSAGSPMSPGFISDAFNGPLASPSDMAKIAADNMDADTGDQARKKHRRSDSGSSGSWTGSVGQKHEHSEESSSGSDEPQEAGEKNQPPAIKQGRLEFTLNGPLQSQLICELCMGYFREPYRITTCLHTFCKSCLLLALERAGHQCPSCQTYLGRLANSNEIPFKPDRLLHDLMDKVLFPELAAADEEAEAEFYASLGIQKKAEFREQRKRDDSKRSTSEKSRLVSFQLVPCAGKSALQRPFLETESSLTISQLKKYLQHQEQKIVNDLFCLGTVLGNEWSVDFVLKTIWHRHCSGEEKLLSIEYR